MGFEETVMSEEKKQAIIDGGGSLKAFPRHGAYNLVTRTSIEQAEVSYKAGREYEHKIMIGSAVDEGNKAFKDGEKRVVKWINKNVEFVSYLDKEWKAQQGKWGID